MSYSKSTLHDCLQNIADKHDSGVLPSDSLTLSYWTRLLNNAQSFCVEQVGITKSASLATTNNVITLPDDFYSIEDVVTSDGIKLSPISKDEAANANGAVYWIDGNFKDGYTLNVTTDGTYTVYYVFFVEKMVNNTDICIFPDPMAVSLHAYAKLRQAETDPLEDANVSLAEVEQRIRVVASNMNENDGGLSFSSPYNG